MPSLPDSPAQLDRALGLRAAVAIGVGGTVGGGIYVLVGVAAGKAGPGALLAFGVAFVAALLIAIPYAELACRYPRAGGGYAFARAAFGARAGFGMGWTFWGAYLFVSGYVTLGFGGYLSALTGVPRLVGALALIAACLAVNLVGVEFAGRAQTVVIVLAVAGLVTFVAWGLPSVDPARLHRAFPHGLSGVMAASLPAFLAFGGFDMVAAAGEEIEHPERNLPRAILITLATVLVLYLAVCFVAVGVLSSKALGSSAAPLADTALRFGGGGARSLVAVTALLTTAATANAVLIVTSRISFAMARDGLLPRPLARLGTRTRAPAGALIASAALLAVVATTQSVALVAAAGGFLYVCHFVVPLAALPVVRRRSSARPAFRTPVPWVVLPLAFGACALLLFSSGASGAAIGLGWMATGAIVHLSRSVCPRQRLRSWCCRAAPGTSRSGP